MGIFYETNLISCLLNTAQWLFKIITFLFENYPTTYVQFIQLILLNIKRLIDIYVDSLKCYF